MNPSKIEMRWLTSSSIENLMLDACYPESLVNVMNLLPCRSS